jgi:hypothetical protein
VLKSQGYTVLASRHPAEALRIAASYPGSIHLLVTDVVMPGMSGQELVEKLMPIRPELKVLYMTGYPEDAIERHRVPSEPGRLLQKPFGPHVLAAKVRELLEQNRDLPASLAPAMKSSEETIMEV